MSVKYLTANTRDSYACVAKSPLFPNFHDKEEKKKEYKHNLLQVRAIYAFSGEPGTAELSIEAGEILTVIRDNVGDGWCEGYNQNAKSGLFPAAYVQIVEATTNTAPGITSSFILYTFTLQGTEV